MRALKEDYLDNDKHTYDKRHKEKNSCEDAPGIGSFCGWRDVWV